MPARRKPQGFESNPPPRSILVLCPFPVGTVPAQRLKYEQYFTDWEANGYSVTISEFFDSRTYGLLYQRGRFLAKIRGTLSGYRRRLRDLLRARKFDLVYVFLWGTPFGPPLFENLLGRANVPIVYDIDDLIFEADGRSTPNAIVSFLKGRQKPRSLIKLAAVVITSTPYLTKYATTFSRNICEISCTVDTARMIRRVSPQNDIPVIGWSGSFSTARYLEGLGPCLQALAVSHRFTLRVVGDSAFSLEGVDVELVPWSAATECDVLSTFDIGLHPIDCEEWALGKSGGKVFLYMSVGVPVVATAFGANYRSVADGESGFLVSTDEEWLARLRLLLDDRNRRLELGDEGRRRAVEWFSIDRHKPVYLRVLEAAYRGESPCPCPTYPDPVGRDMSQS